MKVALIAKITVYALVALILVGVLAFGFSTGFGFGALIGDDFEEIKDIKTYESAVEAKELDTVDISWASGDVTVRLCDGNQIKVTESSKGELSAEERLLMEPDGDTLKIKWREKKALGSFFSFNTKKKQLLVEIPRTMELAGLFVSAASSDIQVSDLETEKLRLESASGRVTVSALTAKDFEVKTVSGESDLNTILCKNAVLSTTSGSIRAEAFTADVLKANSVSGDIQMNGALLSIKANSVSGRINVATGLMPKETVLGSVSGELSLSVPENDGFILEKASVSGAFGSSSVPLETFDKLTYYKDKHAENKVKLSTTSGGMSLEKGVSNEVETYDARSGRLAEAKKSAEEAAKAEEERQKKAEEEASAGEE